MAWRSALVMLLLALAQPGAGAAPAPLAQPNLELFAAGEVYAMARAPDGSVVIGGRFSSVYDPVSQLSFQRDNLARFTPAGGLDLAWNPAPTATGEIDALAIDASGAVYVAGDFFSIGGQSRLRLAKLSGSGSGAADPTWNPGLTGAAYALAIDPGVAIYIGGSFTMVGGLPRGNFAKLQLNGDADPNWNVPANDYVAAIALDGAGAAYIGGFFTTVGSPPQPRSRIAKLTLAGNGAVDATWNPTATGAVNTLALDAPDGALYVGGVFNMIGGAPRAYLAKLATTGAGPADATWNPGANNGVNALALDGAGRLYAGGFFTALGAQQRNYLARVSTAGTGALDSTWTPQSDRNVRQLLVDPAIGDVHVAGRFTEVSGQLALDYARITGAGAVLASPYVQANGEVYALARAADGSTYVGGNFSRAGAFKRQNLLRLAPDGSLDAGWSPNVLGFNPAVNGIVRALALSGGALFVGGNFESVDGVARNKLAKVSTGAGANLDPSWDPAPPGEIFALATDTGGAIIAGGLFYAIGGQNRNFIARLSSTGAGAADPLWNPNANSTVYALAVDATGQVYLGGDFGMVGGLPRARLARVTAAGVVDATWTANTDGSVYALALATNGDLYAGGTFSTPHRRLAKLSSAAPGGADPLWDPQVSTGFTEATALAVDPRGAVFAGGLLVTVGGQLRSYLAKVAGDGTGAVDASWDAAPDRNVRALALDGSGSNLIVGGQFTSVGGVGRRAIAIVPALVDDVFKDGFE